MCLVWKYGEYNKSCEHESKKCHLNVLSIFHLESSGGVWEESLPIFTLGYSRTVSCSPSAFCALLQLVEMLACLLLCSEREEQGLSVLCRQCWTSTGHQCLSRHCSVSAHRWQMSLLAARRHWWTFSALLARQGYVVQSVFRAAVWFFPHIVCHNRDLLNK